MNLEVATNEQVIEWFDARPAYKEMLIEDMRKTLEHNSSRISHLHRKLTTSGLKIFTRDGRKIEIELQCRDQKVMQQVVSENWYVNQHLLLSLQKPD